MSIWIAGKYLMKHHYQIKIIFTVNKLQKILVIKIIRMLKKCLKKFCAEMDDYHYCYVQCDRLFLADVFEKFSDTCIDIYGLDPSCFLSAPGLALKACFKMIEVKLELFTGIHMPLMIE